MTPSTPAFLPLIFDKSGHLNYPTTVLVGTSSEKAFVLMTGTSIHMREQQYEQIKSVLARLRLDTSNHVLLLIDKSGQLIAEQGDISNLDTTSLASLAAGNVAATNGMAHIIGEKEFPTLSHEGERAGIHICVIGGALLVVIFDESSSLGLVKLRVKQSAHLLAAVFDEVVRESNKQTASDGTLFAEITDEDIDSLFN